MTDMGGRVLLTFLLVAALVVVWWPRRARAKTIITTPRFESTESMIPEEDLPFPEIRATMESPKASTTLEPMSKRTVESTAYCLLGRTASGKNVRDGIAAMDNVPFGTQVSVLSGPLEGKDYVIEDRTDQRTELDFWMSSCDEAKRYGRRDVEVQVRP